jgi:hypothetical protein
VHFLAADGAPIDRFNTGDTISGLAVATTGDEGLLVVASGQGVEGWRVKQPADD